MWGIFTLLTIIAALWVVIPWLDGMLHCKTETDDEWNAW